MVDIRLFKKSNVKIISFNVTNYTKIILKSMKTFKREGMICFNDTDDLNTFLNKTKENFLIALFNDGWFEKEELACLMQQYSILIGKKKSFGEVSADFLGHNQQAINNDRKLEDVYHEDLYLIHVVKNISTTIDIEEYRENEEENEEEND